MSNGYQHPNLDPNLMGVQNSMEYNTAGEPALRVIANLNGWGIQVSNGDIEGVSYIEKFGRQSDITNGTTATLWDGVGLYQYLTTPSVLTVTSDKTEDNPTGPGAQTVEVQGLDADYNLITETIPVGATGTLEFLRVFRARVVTAGSYGINWGNISIDDGTNVAIIDGGPNNGPGVGQTFMCVYTVPAGKTAYLTQWAVSSGKQNADTLAKFVVRPFGGAFNTKDIVEIQSNNYIKDYKVPLKFDEKTDIEVRAYSDNGSSAASTFNLILIDNPVEE